MIHITVTAGQKAELRCQARTLSVPNFVWISSPVYFHNDDNVAIDTRNRCSILTINNTQPCYAGNYECKASNCMGTDYFLATVTVKGELRLFCLQISASYIFSSQVLQPSLRIQKKLMYYQIQKPASPVQPHQTYQK